MSYIKNLPTQVRSIVTKAIQEANAPSIFDVDDFVGNDPGFSPESYVNAQFGGRSSGGSGGGASGAGTGGVVNTGGTELATTSAADLARHLNDPYAHSDQFGALNQALSSLSEIVSSRAADLAALSGTLSGTMVNLDELSGTVFDNYLMAENLLGSSTVFVTSGTDSLGRPTRTLDLGGSRGILSASINGVSTGNLDSGALYDGRIVNATIVNSTASLPLCLEAKHAGVGTELYFVARSPFSGTSVSSNFEIHWSLI